MQNLLTAETPVRLRSGRAPNTEVRWKQKFKGAVIQNRWAAKANHSGDIISPRVVGQFEFYLLVSRLKKFKLTQHQPEQLLAKDFLAFEKFIDRIR